MAIALQGATTTVFEANEMQNNSDPKVDPVEPCIAPGEGGGCPIEADGVSIAAEQLARWLTTQLQLPGFVASEDWTSEHTKGFADFCNDPNRRQLFLWMAEPPRPSAKSSREDDGTDRDKEGWRRLTFSEELPAHYIGPLLRHKEVQEGSGQGLVFVSKRDDCVVKPEAPQKQLMCLSFHCGVLEQVVAFIRGVCIPVLGDNPLWPQSFKKELVRRVG